MKFIPLALPGAYLIEIEPFKDERGFFARTWCENEFKQNGLNPIIKQCSVSVNLRAGTLRGLHYQAQPQEEAKLVRCTRGEIFDVLVDLRPDTPTYCRWAAETLSADNHRMLYIPEGCAHGFQTLTDDSEVLYQISEVYHSESARGVRWNDPAFGIAWPAPPASGLVMSNRDRDYPDFRR